MLKRVEIWIAIALSALYVYLQIIVWQKQGIDVTLEAIRFVITVALWFVLIVAIVRTRTRTRETRIGETDATPENQHPIPNTTARTREQWNALFGADGYFTDRTFSDTEVKIDGKVFTSCTFNRVRFRYDGTRPWRFQNCHIDEQSRSLIITSNPLIGSTFELSEFMASGRTIASIKVEQHENS